MAFIFVSHLYLAFDQPSKQFKQIYKKKMKFKINCLPENDKKKIKITFSDTETTLV